MSEQLKDQRNFKQKKNSLLLFFFSSLWLLNLLNQAYFQGAFEVSEAREGVVINEIKEYRTWILPLRHGEVVPSKPPLFHWLTALLTPSDQPIDQLGLRIVSLISAIVCLFAVFTFLKNIKRSSRTISDSATPAVISLSSTYAFVQLAIDGRVDMLFASIFTLSILTLNKLLLAASNTKPSKKESVFLGILLGLGILARGPLMIVMFLLCIIAGILSLNKLKLLKSWSKLNTLLLVGISVLLSAPWYIASQFMGKPELLKRQLIFENLSRFMGSEKIPGKPFWFYFEHIWLQTFPWCVLLAFFIYLAVKQKDLWKKSENFRLIKLFASQFLILLLFLSLSHGKRKAYLLPLIPLSSVVLGLSYSLLKDKLNRAKFWNFLDNSQANSPAFLSLIFLCLNALGIGIKVALDLGLENFVSSSFFLGLSQLNYGALIIPSLSSLSLFLLITFKKPLNSLHIIWILAFQMFLTLPAFFFLTKGESHSLKLLAKEIRSVSNYERLNIIKAKSDESFDSLLFYLGKRVNLTPLDGPSSDGLYIARESWLLKNSSKLEGKIIRLHEGKRLADEKNKNIILFRFKSEEVE